MGKMPEAQNFLIPPPYLVVSMMVSFLCCPFFPRGVLDEILNLIESVSEVFSSYSYYVKIKVIALIINFG